MESYSNFISYHSARQMKPADGYETKIAINGRVPVMPAPVTLAGRIDDGGLSRLPDWHSKVTMWRYC
ncbi:hypothetical protein A33O_02673 [Nitratireductor aquibiodomus RA22]|uniref:Uncharacterized protein n=2 Tax=Nitratireductor aquibiodomus TaxID=204799 RepID=I5C699_9HYPH|nr:hypothetical protein A33O_02673 [Nitratireductor aquibiodomus RA22]